MESKQMKTAAKQNKIERKIFFLETDKNLKLLHVFSRVAAASIHLAFARRAGDETDAFDTIRNWR